MSLARWFDPTFLMLVALGAALLWLGRSLRGVALPSRRPFQAVVALWGALWLLCTPVLGTGLLRLWEAPPGDPGALLVPALRDRTALVVLSSSVMPAVPGVPARERLDAACTARTLAASRLYAALEPAGVIVTGIAPGPVPDATSRAMAELLMALGVPAGRIVRESAARNTRENARFSVALARSRGWTRLVVVTSAVHMRRSLAEFRRAGVEPVGAPVDFVGKTFPGAGAFLPSSGGASRVGQVVHEILGFLRP